MPWHVGWATVSGVITQVSDGNCMGCRLGEQLAPVSDWSPAPLHRHKFRKQAQPTTNPSALTPTPKPCSHKQLGSHGRQQQPAHRQRPRSRRVRVRRRRLLPRRRPLQPAHPGQRRQRTCQRGGRLRRGGDAPPGHGFHVGRAPGRRSPRGGHSALGSGSCPGSCGPRLHSQSAARQRRRRPLSPLAGTILFVRG
eukprot:jgi/Mesvir1/12978/Mv26285-RA.1